MKQVVTKNDWPRLAREVLSQLKPKSGAAVLGLRGDLGAGKTTFTQALARELGVTEPVTSPTFVIEKIYPLLTGYPFRRLIHLDCYRLEQAEELTALGLAELLKEPANLIVIEWPERAAELLPPATLIINFESAGENTRTVRYGED